MALSQEREEFRSYLRAFLDQHCRTSEVRPLSEPTEFDVQMWRRMAAELGLQGLGIPEYLGGSGASWVELGVTFEELGRGLTCSPYLATVALAVPALLLSGDDEAASAWLPRIAAGECIATVAMPDTMSDLGPAANQHVWNQDHTPLLSGQVPAVIDGAGADLLIVCGNGGGGVEDTTLFLVNGDAPGLTRTPLTGIDGTRRFAAVECDNTPAVVLGRPGTADRVIAEVNQCACVAVAA